MACELYRACCCTSHCCDDCCSWVRCCGQGELSSLADLAGILMVELFFGELGKFEWVGQLAHKSVLAALDRRDEVDAFHRSCSLRGRS